jgi:hypothetical protein
MKMIKIAALVPPLLADSADAQLAMPMPMLTPSECSQISQVGPGVFELKGKLRIAGTDFNDTRISVGTVLDSGVDVGRYIERSCFSGKPTK